MTRAFALAGVGALALWAMPAQADELRDAVAEDMPGLVELYRDLHANPELSFQEFETAKKLAARARALGFAVTEGVGRTGVVAVMRNGEGPTVMLRADMDGLPVIEQTGLPFASKRKGVPASGIETGIMHACGHDTHMAAWVGAAQLLAERRDEWSGTLVMILQPAEEIGEGAKAMLDDGLYTRFPKPDYVLAFHDAAQAPAGFIGYSKGFALANVDSVDIVVPGVGGHGAYPHTTKDPIVIASHIVTRLQTLVSRELDPQEPAVVTVGSFQAGAKHNIIPDEARLQITVRSYADKTRQHLLDGIARIARGEALAAGMPEDKLPRVTVSDPYTPCHLQHPRIHRAGDGRPQAALRGPGVRDPGGDGRRGFQPVLPRRPRECGIADLLGGRGAAGPVGTGAEGRDRTALAALAVLGARRPGGDRHRYRGPDRGDARPDGEEGRLGKKFGRRSAPQRSIPTAVSPPQENS